MVTLKDIFVNLMLNFVKKRGISVVLPVLLAATACGEETAFAPTERDGLPDLSDVTLTESEAVITATSSRRLGEVQSNYGSTTSSGLTTVRLTTVLGTTAAQKIPDVAIEDEALADDGGKVAPARSVRGLVAATQTRLLDTAVVPVAISMAGLTLSVMGLSTLMRRRAG
ncbi:MAG: hypothetical protein AAFY72_04265 [Cyanobacteria bacterium J06649_4]